MDPPFPDLILEKILRKMRNLMKSKNK